MLSCFEKNRRVSRESGFDLVQFVLADPVTLKRLRTTVKQERFAVMTRVAKERQHHILVIALQKYHLGVAMLGVDQQFDNIIGGGPAINVIADENHCVAAPRSDTAHQRRQFIHTSMDIADCKQPAACLRHLALFAERHPWILLLIAS